MFFYLNKDDDVYDVYDVDFWMFMNFYYIMLMN